MIKRAAAAWRVLKAGEQVSDPKLWKERQVSITMITGFLWAALHAAEAFGVNIPVDDGAVDAIGMGVLALVNTVLTYATTRKIGISN